MDIEGLGVFLQLDGRFMWISSSLECNFLGTHGFCVFSGSVQSLGVECFERQPHCTGILEPEMIGSI